MPTGIRTVTLENYFLQDCNRREGSPAATTDARTHREKAAHDWQLDEALKSTRNATMISVLDSDSDRPSDQEKNQPAEENQPEKPKVADTRKPGRPPGRPRKLTNKNTKGGHRTPEENLKNGKPRNRTRGVGSPKKKAPLSKPTITTSDDGSDDRSQGASSDSDSDRPTRVSPVVVPINEKRSKLSASSSEDERPPNRKNNSASDDDNTRWRRMPIKRSKLADSPKKQEKRKSPAKAKPRRSNSRVTNVGGSDSDSESELSVRNRIQVAR